MKKLFYFLVYLNLYFLIFTLGKSSNLYASNEDVYSSDRAGMGQEQPMNYVVSEEYKAKSYDYRIKFLVLHYTAESFEASVETLTCGPASSHYLIPREQINGKKVAFQLVEENLRAWTEGVSFWKGRNNLNDTAIGVEIVNAGYKEENEQLHFFPFTDYQVEIVIDLCKDIINRYGIEPVNVLGHSDVAPGRKTDPGPLFPWEKLYNSGIGAWPDAIDVKEFKEALPDHFDIKSLQEDLAKYGYDVNTDGVFLEKTKHALTAFQMHFRPSNYDGNIDRETVAILKALLKKYRPN